MKIIVCGGGTGGHIYPAIAIADYFVEKNQSTEVLYIGGKYGIENKVLPNYKYRFVTIDIKGFQRKLSLENIKRIYKSLKSTVNMYFLLKKEKPDIVIGTGGYVCGPVLYMASLLNIKTAILEQNVSMGLTNKILAKKVNYIFYGFEDSLKKYDFKNSFVSGNPIRKSDFSKDKNIARDILNYNKDEKIIFSVGGSGGSEELNESIFSLANYCQKYGIRLIHVCGQNHYEVQKEKFDKFNYDKFELYPYINEIGNYIISSDLVICSAGASTLAEVTYCGKASIVIPKAYTAENHQEFNARMIEENEAGYYILDTLLNGDKLVEKVDKIINDEILLKKMSINSKKLSHENACEVIYNKLILEDRSIHEKKL